MATRPESGQDTVDTKAIWEPSGDQVGEEPVVSHVGFDPSLLMT